MVLCGFNDQRPGGRFVPNGSILVTLRAKLSVEVIGPVCFFVCWLVCVFVSGFVWLFACLWVCYHDNLKLRASILTKLGL